jgi:pimeloyl-ACP methyl ester carboxylesterase
MTFNVKSVELVTGVTLQYVEKGNPAGIAVLLLHGIGDSWRSFELVLPNLPDSIHAFALTQRGHGDSSRPEEGYSSYDFAADLVAFMDTLQLETAFLVGHSSPGTTAARRFAIEYPERTMGIVLIGPIVDMPNSQMVQDLWDSAVSKMEDPVDAGFVRELQESTLARPTPPSFSKIIMDEPLKVPARVWKSTVKANLEDDLTESLNRIKVPTLLVWGDRDEQIQRSEQETLLRIIPDSQLLVYEGHGHSLHWEAPERLAKDLVNFIENVVG